MASAAPAGAETKSPPPEAAPETSTALTTIPGAKTSTKVWDNGAIVQKQTLAEPQPGVVEKQTTTWNNSNGTPSTTVTTTTTTRNE